MEYTLFIYLFPFIAYKYYREMVGEDITHQEHNYI